MLQKFIHIILIGLLCSPLLVLAQKGSIAGYIKDSGNNEDVIGASVFLEGTTIGSATDVSGNFQFAADPGTHNLIVTYVGYKKLVVTGLVVKPGEEVKLVLQMESDGQQLEEVVVQAQADKTSDAVLLMERKKSIEMVQTIGAQELLRKGVSDVEAAVTQVTGVSKQQGVKNVFVRGLGDRYNSTSLNGLPLPSEDPSYKNIALSFFSTDIVDNIDVNKTFSSNLYGDVAGANINIVSKKLFEEKELNISGSIGANSQVMVNDFYRADGNNFLGTVDNSLPISDLTQYTFRNSFQPNKISGTLPNLDLSVSGGRAFNLAGNSLKLFAVASMSSDYTFKEGKASFTNTEGQYRNDYTYKKYEYHATQFALSNVTYEYGRNNFLSYNLIYIHDNKQYVADFKGFSLNGVDDINEPNAYDMLVKRQQTNNNSLMVNQLINRTNISDKLSLDVSGSFNTIRGDEPDRRQNYLIGDGTGENYVANNSSPAFNHRFFATLKENEIALNTVLTYQLNEKGRVVAGYNFRTTDRSFDFVQYNFAHPSGASVDPDNLDGYFNQENINNGTIVMETSRGKIGNPNALIPFYYEGSRNVHAGYLNFHHEFNDAWSFLAGVRFEKFSQEIVWSVGGDERRENISGDNTVNRNKNYILPSLGVKFNASDNDQIRFSVSQTYTYPQFKELAPFLYEDVNENVFGNPNLRPATNLNFDLKYEHYFSGDELVAVTGFYKVISNAINMVQVNSAALEYSYLNTGDATVFGGEIEVRKKIFNFSRSESSYITMGSSISYLYSNQVLENDPDSEVQFIPTHQNTQLEGASPWLVNTDITFHNNGSNGKRITSALVLNAFSKRVYSLGTSGQDNIYERGVPALDWISKIGLSHRLNISFSLRNILNPEYRTTKKVLSTGKDDIISSFKKGTTSSIGLSYRF
jgi:outer membrane receptor protein involved in Fe transport